MKGLQRTGWTAVAILVALAAWLRVQDDVALDQAQAGLKRALATYAVARGVNATISWIKSTEVAFAPGGVGVATTPGELLDPLDDLIEQFSDLMLAASVAFGAQIALIKIGAHWIFALLLSLGALALVALMWSGRSPPSWLMRVVVVLAFVRFAAPAAALASDLAYRAFLAPEYGSAQSELERTAKTIDTDEPWWKKGDPREWIKNLRDISDKAVRYAIDLMVVFLLQTIAIPLCFLWLLIVLGRALSISPRARETVTPALASER